MFNNNSEFIVLKDDLWLKRQKVAGSAVSKALTEFAKLVHPGTDIISLKDIEKISLQILSDMNCTPTFLGYDGFPGAICISVNENLVHGVPTDYVLQDGDVVTLDLGATYEGAIADAAFTCIYGTPKDIKHVEMLKLCQDSLMAGVNAFEVHKKIGVIGYAIFKTARNNGFGIVTDYGGHGIEYNKPHAYPFVANKSNQNDGVMVQKGMSIAIEPMLVMNDSVALKTLDDGFTIAAKYVGCHFEHSVTIDMDGNKHIVTEHGMDVLDYAGVKV